MAEIELQRVSMSFGGGALLDHVSLAVERGERIGLVGRNGAGKSTLLAILAGELAPDEGEVVRRTGVTVATLAQAVPAGREGTVRELCEAAVVGDADHAPEHDWEAEKRVSRALERLKLDPDAKLAELSAGTLRRALLARALCAEPDVLVLDEPTNHLDLDSVLALEESLLSRRGALVFVTHDRAFLRRVATRIVDLDRGNLRSFECDYATYLDRNADRLAAEEKADAEFDKKLAQEEVWIRKGILARRTRNMGRVRALVQMRKERAERRERAGAVRAKLVEAERSGTLLLRAKGLRHSFGAGDDEVKIADGFDFELLRGDRVGVVGPNGCGKSTLLKLLLGEIEPDEGEVRHGTKLLIGRFDQLHDGLREDRSVLENVCPGGDTVTVGGTTRHALGYLQDFLFTPDQALGPVGRLSGGEKNRVQLARILARPCNLLVLDEPTNDLDVPTLELLEEMLEGFGGTLLLVSHDREFLDNVVTSIVVSEGDGVWTEHVGGYTDWRERREAVERAEAEVAAKKAAKSTPAPGKATAKSGGAKKLTYPEEHELKGLPDKIEALEAEHARLAEPMHDPAFYKQPAEVQKAAHAALARATEELERAMARWEELESLR